ncbi:MAG: hypothetical protein QW746_04975, partial [Thermoplasmata archaeon]
GLPRSGTTLTCHLLNKLPDTVALHEPMKVWEFPKLKNHDAIINEIKLFFEEMRQLIRTRKIALSKQADGKVPDNPFPDKYSSSGLRCGKVSVGMISVKKELSLDFLLIIKHPAAFTALLETLIKHFPCYAVIRNPLAILTSWNSIAAPIQNGYAPAAENLDIDLKHALAGIKDKIGRQLYLLSWFFEKYLHLLSNDNILRYEDIVSSGGKALHVITPHALLLDEKLKNKNKNVIYDPDKMRVLGERLLYSKGAYWEFYSKESIELLLN